MRQFIPREALVPILEHEIAIRNDDEGQGGLSGCANAIAASGAMKAEAAYRRMYAILSGETQTVSFEAADKLLTGLDRQDAWWLELAPYAEVSGALYDPDYEHDHTCAVCQHWIDFEGSSVAGVRIEMKREGRWSWWSLCHRCAALRLPVPLDRPDATGRVNRRIPWEEVRRLYVAYVENALTLEELVAPHIARWGFKSARSAAVSVTHDFRQMGLPLRSRSESKTAAARRRGPRVSKQFRGREQELRTMHTLHVRKDVSINQLSRAAYRRYGFGNAKQMTSALSQSWKALGLKARDRIEMTVVKSTKNGLSPRDAKLRRERRKAAGLTTKGHERQPPCILCSRPAMHGKPYCYSHDPERREEIVAHVTDMRSRSPKHDPENLIQIGELAESLREWFEWNGGRWAPLTEMTGWSNTSLRRMSQYPPEKLILKTTAERLRTGLEQASQAREAA